MLHVAARLTVVMLVTIQAVAAQSNTPLAPTAPGTPGDPTWQAVVLMSDGRRFITDGGMAVDTAFAKPATLPVREVPGKVMEGYISVPHRDEYGFGDLGSASGKTYTTPNGIALSSTYVNYLRRILPRNARFRTTEKQKPVVVVSGSEVVCVLMPVAQP